MRNVMISMLIVVLAASGICAFAASAVETACSEVEAMCDEAQQLCKDGQRMAAFEKTTQMLLRWRQYEARLTVVLHHSTISDVTQMLIEAQTDLLAGETDKFSGDMILLEEFLENICDAERLHLSNILSIC